MLVANCRTEHDPELPGIPPWFFFAQDHALFGLILLVTQERRSFWLWADDVLFRGMNFGMGGFVIRLLLDARRLERVFTPIMGLSILLALLTSPLRISRPSEPEAVEMKVGAEHYHSYGRLR